MGFGSLQELTPTGCSLRHPDFRSIRRCAKIAPVSMLKIPAAEIPKFRRRMLSWFAERKRDLPWRRTRDPYRIWLSEIMLQQTRVAAVIPYYERFLETFPNVQALARARTDRVLAELGRPRLLQPREKFATRGKGNRLAACGQFSARIRSGAGASGHRTLHRGGGFEHRLRRAARGAGRKRRARARADRRLARRFARAGHCGGNSKPRRRICSLEMLPATGTRP